MINGYLTIKEVAERLGVSDGRIRQLVAEKKLQSIKIGKSNLIAENDLASVTIHGKAGRPKKDATAGKETGNK